MLPISFIINLYLFAISVAVLIVFASRFIIYKFRICSSCFKRLQKSPHTNNWLCATCGDSFEIKPKRIRIAKERKTKNKKKEKVVPNLSDFNEYYKPKKYSLNSQFSEELWNKNRKFK